MSASRQEISGDASSACVSGIWPCVVIDDERETGDEGARTACEATRLVAKDQVSGEAGTDPRKKCMRKDEISDLGDT